MHTAAAIRPRGRSPSRAARNTPAHLSAAIESDSVIDVRVRSRARVALLVFVAGGLGGALLDQIHVRAHVLGYAHPDLAGQPWWVGPQFGIAVLAILLTVMGFQRAAPSRDRAPFAFDAASFVLAYVLTGVFRRHPWVVLLLLLAMWVVMLLVHGPRRWVVAVSLGLAVVGPIYESLLTWTGAFHYTVTPLVLRVPVWLPALYLNAGVLAASAARALASERVRAPARTTEPAPSSPAA